MNKLFTFLLFIALCACNQSLEQKAIKLITADDGDYISTPVYDFKGVMVEIIDKEVNDLKGYYMIYDVTVGGDKSTWMATFNKDVTVLTDLKPVIEGVHDIHSFELK